MTTLTFVDRETVVPAAWLNDVDALVWDVFNGKTTAGTSGTILRSNGTNIVNTTATYPTTVTVNRLIYASATNTISDLATANSSILTTNSSGVPSWTTSFPDTIGIVGSSDATKKLRFEVDGFTTGQTRVITPPDADLTIPAVTAKGDIMAASASGVLAKLAVGSNGDMLVPSSGATAGVVWVGQGGQLFNGSFSVSVAANALTIALKTDGGADPSSSDPVIVSMPNTTGGFTTYTITAATSLAISSGSTLGTVSAVAHRVYFGLADDGGTLRLWAYNPYSYTAGPPEIHSLLGIIDGQTYSSTAEGGAGAADSAQVLYSGTAFTTKAVRALGYFESTQATAGTWATTPSLVHVLKPGDKRTGDLVQFARNGTGATSTTTTTIPGDDTIPQNTEGAEFMSQAVTPSFAGNLLNVKARLNMSSDGGVGTMVIALFQDTTANALAATFTREIDASPQIGIVANIEYMMRAGTTSSTTFKARAGGTSAGTVRFNGTSGGRFFGGVCNSTISVEEIFA